MPVRIIKHKDAMFEEMLSTIKDAMFDEMQFDN
jgi:hypothetical protein